MSNLPERIVADSAAATKLFFNTYGEVGLEFASAEVDITISFFLSNGFETDAAISTALILLQRAKQEQKSVYTILDTLKFYNGIQLSAVVAQILNSNRQPTSSLGYKSTVLPPATINRNILP